MSEPRAENESTEPDAKRADGAPPAEPDLADVAHGEPPAESLLRAFRDAAPTPPEQPSAEPAPHFADASPPAEPARTAGWGQPPRWGKVLLAVAAVMILVGAGLQLSSGGGGVDTEGQGGVEGVDGGPTPNTLVANGPESDPSSATEGEPSAGIGSLSPFFLKGGFGLFLGFAVGYALRAFLKLALLVSGVFALGMTALAYTGLVEIDWATMGGYFDALVERVGEEAGEFRTFLTGSLPSAGMAALGLVAGFKRR